MEFGLASRSKCLSYDVDQARLVLLQDGERHEISIRAQGHRLVRYMAERNEAGGGPALCTHEELMQAVWADEPMHSREELAKLFWELRKKLEPFGAAQLIENERGRGYRLQTCPSPPVGAPAADAPPARGAGRRSGRVVAVAILVGLGLLAAAIVIATRGHGSGHAQASTALQRTFVDRVENATMVVWEVDGMPPPWPQASTARSRRTRLVSALRAWPTIARAFSASSASSRRLLSPRTTP